MRRVLAVVPDLFFATKIAATAKALGVALVTSSPHRAAAAFADAAERGEPFALVLLDLHAPGGVLGRVAEIRGTPAAPRAPVVGFYSHVDTERRQAALAAGVDHVLPRSAFTLRLPQILLGEPLAPPSGEPS
jgi:CheY-like chemotaxis protein